MSYASLLENTVTNFYYLKMVFFPYKALIKTRSIVYGS